MRARGGPSRRPARLLPARQAREHQCPRDAVFYGNEGRIRLHTLDRQSTQAAALALVSAAIVTWNTHHMNEIVERERAAGRPLDDIDFARLSPAIHAHINLNGPTTSTPDRPPRRLVPGRDGLATYK
jgi:hypothetical protein